VRFIAISSSSLPKNFNFEKKGKKERKEKKAVILFELKRVIENSTCEIYFCIKLKIIMCLIGYNLTLLYGFLSSKFS
jgi:hypothetical protein